MIRNISLVLKELNDVYTSKDCMKMRKLLDEAVLLDPKNIYLDKYEKLYDSICWKEIDGKMIKWGKLIKFKWRTIKCTHCGANVWMSTINKIIVEDYLTKKTKELKFRCKNCNTNFVWKPVTLPSLFSDIRVWEKKEFNWVKYNVTWWVKYKGKWKEKTNIWDLTYIEWLLVDPKGEIMYFSESKADWSEDWESWVEKETEFSCKAIPDFDILELTDNNIKTSVWEFPIKEIDDVKVVSIIWENSKSYTIWEKVKTYSFLQDWLQYILEKEESGTQREINLYKTVVDNAKYAGDKKLNWIFEWFNNAKEKSNRWMIFVGAILLLAFPILLILAIPLFLIHKYVDPNKFKNIAKISWILFVWFLSTFTFLWLEHTTTADKLINSDVKSVKWTYSVKLPNQLIDEETIKSTSYSRWGTRHYKKWKTWLKFTIKSEKDQQILRDLLSDNQTAIKDKLITILWKEKLEKIIMILKNNKISGSY